MAKNRQIAALLKADLGASSDLASIAKMLEKKGRGNDTILAHITQKEAQILKDMGGSGTVNPETGLLEFFDGDIDPYAGFGLQDLPADMPASQGLPDVDPYAGFGLEGQPAEAAGFQSVSRGFPAVDPNARFGLQPPAEANASPVTPVAGAGRGDLIARPATAPGLGATPTAAEVTPPPQEKSFFQKLASGLTTQDMVRLGLAGGLGVLGMQRARAGAKQAAGAQREQAAIGQPYQQQGQALVGAAMRGELTPVGQQSLQALQARLAQGVEQRGGVGAAQAAAQAEAYRQQLLQGQYDYGLKVSSIGDQIALGAIKTGMQADQQLQQASTNFYTNLAAIAGGLPMRVGS